MFKEMQLNNQRCSDVCETLYKTISLFARNKGLIVDDFNGHWCFRVYKGDKSFALSISVPPDACGNRSRDGGKPSIYSTALIDCEDNVCYDDNLGYDDIKSFGSVKELLEEIGTILLV